MPFWGLANTKLVRQAKADWKLKNELMLQS